MKLYLPQPAKQEYRLTGIGCSVLNDTAFAAGTRNVAGGHQLKIASFDAAARKLTIAEGEPGKLAAGMALHLWTCADDDNSPYELKIVNVDAEARTVTVDRDLDLKKEQLETAAEWIAAVPDLTREAAAFAAGDLCFATGEYAFASGSLTLAGGFGAHAEGILCEARGDMSFAVGNMTRADGLAAVATGTNTRASGMFSTSIGAATVAAGDSSLAAGSGSEAAGDSAVAIGFRTKATRRGAFAAGALAEANAEFSAAIGRQVKTAAAGSLIAGSHGELPDTVENRGAFAFAAGETSDPRIALLIQPNRAIKNPLYPQEGEPEYLPEPDFALTVSGHLLPATVTAPGNALTLDHSRAGRWKITPTANVTPVLKNWRDGDRGELVVYNGGSKVLFPAAWHWLGSQPALKSAGVDIFTIFQIDDLIYIRHAEAGGNGGGTPGGSVDESRLLPALDSIPVGRNGNPVVFNYQSGVDDDTLCLLHLDDATWADATGKNTITQVGTVAKVSPGYFGNALDLTASLSSGGLSWLQIPWINAYNTESWTIEFLAKPTKRLVNFTFLTFGNNGFMLNSENLTNIRMNGYSADYTFNLNEWYWFVLQFDGTATKLYINANLVLQANFVPDISGKTLQLGSHYEVNNQDNTFVGLLDEFRWSKGVRYPGGVMATPTQPFGTPTKSYEVSDKAPIAVEAPADGELLIGQGGKFVKITLAELKARLNALS